MLRMFTFAFLITFLWIAAPLSAQEMDQSLVTIDRIFAQRDFTSESFGPARWLKEGSSYTTVEKSKEAMGGRDIVRYETKSGKREVMVPASRLIPSGATAPLSIDDYHWSPDGKLLLLYTNSKRVWRTNTRGDYWVVNLSTWKMSKLGGDAPPSTLMFAKFSPDGRRIGYVRDHNIYVEDISTSDITQLTHDGSRTIINGTFDWVYEEEFHIQDGFRWSPDGKTIAYWQLNAEGVRDFFMINNTDSLYSFIIPIQYPKAGTTNSACKVGVVSTAGGGTRWFNTSDDLRNNYIPRMEWAENSEDIVIQHINRLQNTNHLILGNINTLQLTTILTETDEAWVDAVDDMKWLEGGKHFTWVSDRSGWRHVYLVSRDGKDIRDITPGNFDVVSISNIDSKNGWLYYIASPYNPTQRYLYRSKLDGSGKPIRLSPMNQSGTHSYQMAPSAEWAIHTFSDFSTPSVISLVKLPGHEVVRTLAANKTLLAKVNALKRKPVEFFRVKNENGIEFDGWQMLPPDFDSAKKYPILMYVYGEPASQTVIDRWGGGRYLWHLMLTQQGYIVASIDNRGAPAPRGREWKKSIYGKIGIINAADQASAIREIRNWAHVDATRVGVWGWSGGGSTTLNLMFQYPDLYKTGISVAPIGDHRYYDTIYQERYMGLPDENAEGYKMGSAVTHADKLKGNLLLIHGTGDDNVHYQNSESVINAMIKANKSFTMMAYPNRAHGIMEGQNTSRHLYNLMTQYLNTNLPAGPLPR